MRRTFSHQVAAAAIVLSIPASAGADWRELRPQFGGWVTRIAPGPGGTVYIGTTGGIFRSQDAGATWASANGDLPSPPIAYRSPVAADPVQVGVVYAWSDVGLFHSTDSGRHWTRLPLDLPAGVFATEIAIARSSPNIVYVSTWGDYAYRSADSGASWQRLANSLDRAQLKHIAVDPTDPDRVYTNTKDGFFYRSEDGGSTWQRKADDTAPGINEGYDPFAIAPSSPNVIYRTDGNLDAEILKSVDYGDTWSSLGDPSSGVGGCSAGQIAVHPADSATVYAACNNGGNIGGVYRSVGGGAWTLVFRPDPALSNTDSVAISAGNPSHIYVGSRFQGFHRSLDAGVTWSAQNGGLAAAPFAGLRLCRSVPSTLYAGVQGAGIIRSTDSGTTWADVGSFASSWILGLEVHPQLPDTALVNLGGVNELKRTTDGGGTFGTVASIYAGPFWMHFNPLDPTRVNGGISDGAGGFLYSGNGGASWSVPAGQYMNIYADFAYHPAAAGVVFALGSQFTGSPNNTLWVLWSNDGGSASWTDTTSGTSMGSLTGSPSLALDQSDPSTLYVAAALPDEGTEGVYKLHVTYSGANVATVTRVPGTFNAGLTNTVVRRLVYDGATSTLYASTASGIFRSMDRAQTWSLLPGLPFPPTEFMDVTADGSRLIAATGGGIWEWTAGAPSPKLSIADAGVAEGGSGTSSARFTVTVSPAPGSPISVQYATAAGTAIAGVDYQTRSGILSFDATTTSRTFNVSVLGDTTAEANETFFVDLANASPGTAITKGRGVGTILNDDGVGVSIVDAAVQEGNADTTPAVFTLTLGAASAQAVTVDYATEDGTALAGSDYQAVSGTVTFGAGTTSTTISVPITGDTEREQRETFHVRLANATNATLAVAAATGIVNDDDATWTQTRSLSAPRNDHTSTLLLDGRVLVVGGGTAEVYDAAKGAWMRTEPLNAARARHTATLLPGGRVLIVGGTAGNETELFDPSDLSWTLAAPTGVAGRMSHTATLLPDGRVLVVGGTVSGNASLRAEIFTPPAAGAGTGAWSDAADMGVARTLHTATLLPNGTVLVAGGRSSGALNTAETYDPITNLWTPAGLMGSARSGHRATLLPSGKVLAVGGSGPPPLGTAELYDPSSRLWTATGSLVIARAGLATALAPSGEVVALGGTQLNGASTREVEIYRPSQGTWSRGASLAIGRSSPTVTVLGDGRLLVVGGHQFLGHTAEIHDPAAPGWKAAPPLVTPRSGHTSTLLPDGRVLIVGPGATAEIHDPVSGPRSATAPLHSSRQGHTATLLVSGKVLVAGGGAAEAEVFDPAQESWTLVGPMSRARSEHTATLLPNGRVLVVGGWESLGDPLPSAEIFDPVTGTWAAAGSLATARYAHTASLLHDGGVLIMGGWGPGGAQRTAEIFDPRLGRWTPAGSASFPRFRHAAVTLQDGRVLAAGGLFGVGAAPLQDVEVYERATDTWTVAGTLSTGRESPTATLLPDGNVLVAGGFDGTSWPASIEVYDPGARTFFAGTSPVGGRYRHTATLLPSGAVLIAGGFDGSIGDLESAALYDPAPVDAARRPVVTSLSGSLAFDAASISVTGTGFGGVSEASGGSTQNSSTRYPLIRVRSIESGRSSWIPATPDPDARFSDDPMTLRLSKVPEDLDPGWHTVTVVTAGVSSISHLAAVTCSVGITAHPQDQAVALGARAVFSVEAQGARSFQWQRDGADIVGATGSSYTTPAASGADSATRYRVRVAGACATALSSEAVLTVVDGQAPSADVTYPTGGEFWVLSSPDALPKVQRLTWTMADDIRVCRVRVSLRYSNNGGVDWTEAPAAGGLPRTFGQEGSCPAPGEATTNHDYTLPATFPSGQPGSLYKVRVQVWDPLGQAAIAESANPFSIVQSSPESVRTLVLTNLSRMESQMGVTAPAADALHAKLAELALHPRVSGLLVPLESSAPLTALYAAWDGVAGGDAVANVTAANALVAGIHEYLREEVLSVYTGVKYVIVVGDDRIIPMARLRDDGLLLRESSYVGTSDLTTASAIGLALEENRYLSDDPLAVVDPLSESDLATHLFLPDLTVGRLVETPTEIEHVIGTFLGQDGVLDLTSLDPASGHKVLVTGYDFLADTAKRIEDRWKGALGATSASTVPVNSELIGQSWDAGGLRDRLSGLYGVMSLSGHATHYLEGVPGSGPFDIQGVSARDLHGPDACLSAGLDAVPLPGSIVYGVGCHAGLPVAGSCASDADHSLDVPQTLMSQGVVAYVANTGYGWGLKNGIGYSERLVQILTEEMTKGGTIVVGDAVRKTKQRYLLEAPLTDAYDEKTLMQWTLFGLPMYAVRTGIAVAEGLSAPAPAEDGRASLGKIGLSRTPSLASAALPSSLTRLDLHFDLTAAGVHTKRTSSGAIASASPGCSDPLGCYYELNGLSARASGVTDLPIQPYLIYDSRLSGTSQHGVLWKGGVFKQESGWVPVIAELQSNASGNASQHGSTPRISKIKMISQRIVPGLDPDQCRPTDTELNSLFIPTGEALKPQSGAGSYTMERLYREIDLEVFYFNNSQSSTANCDRTGPALGAAPFSGKYHQVSGTTVTWAVPASDASGVWRVIAVVNDNRLDAQGLGTWVPVELADDGTGTWRGSSQPMAGAAVATYVLQAVDKAGNVTWLDYEPAQLPGSGVDNHQVSRVPAAVDAVFPQSLELSSATYGAVEGVGSVAITVTRTSGTTGAVSARYATSNGSALSGSDYTAVSGTLSFGAGVTSRTFGIPILDDTLDEDEETIMVSLSQPGGNAAIGTPAAATVTIADDDTAGAASFSVATETVAEGGAVTFMVRRSGGTASGAAVGFTTSDGSAKAAGDYTASFGTLSFGASETSHTFSVAVGMDSEVEQAETFSVELRSPGGGLTLGAPSQATITISDGTAVLQWSAASYSGPEAGKRVINVTRSGGLAGGVTVEYATANGSALAGIDYAARTGTLSFGPGEPSRTAAIMVKSDSAVEGLEDLRVVLSSPSAGAALGARVETEVDVEDDDGRAIYLRSVGHVVSEGAGKVTVKVQRSGLATAAASVTLATAAVTAQAGSDFTSVNRIVTLKPGVSSVNVSVPIKQDTLAEGNETFRVVLKKPSGAVLGTQKAATVTIMDDETASAVFFTATQIKASEAAGTILVSVSRSGDATGTIDVSYSTSRGTAVDGVDFLGISGTLRLDPGVLGASFPLTILDDAAPETSETVELDLGAPAGAVLGTQRTATITIVEGR